MKAIRRFTVRTVLPETIAPLRGLARNLRWSWHEPTENLFAELDPRAWEAVHGDPVKLLGSLTREEIQQIAQDPELVARVRELDADLQNYLTEDHWYQRTQGPDAPAAIAYFSAEYGITSALPQYSGGLGILAGDHLKTASDMGIPVLGVGLLYQAGYFKQSLSRDGWQQETYPVLDPDELPLTLLREADGSPARITLPLPDGRALSAQIWRADVGRVPLLLLDSNIPDNDDAARNVTDRLYGGGSDHRLRQELLLGMGGIRALRVHSRLTGAPTPEVYHCNEGHAGFLGIERIQELMHPCDGTTPMTWDEALAAVRAATVFTTHTPVPAGIDRFERAQVEHFLAAGPTPDVPVERVLELGAETYPGGDPGKFNMAVMGLRLAQRANGVAQLHGAVSRSMFQGLWQGFDADEVPISSVTNGVHVPSWIDPVVWDLAVEPQENDLDPAARWRRIHEVPDAELWAARRLLRERLVVDVRERLRASWKKRGAADAELGWTESVLDPDVLTIGFARRVPTYKRLTLMLRDPQRLKRLLLDPQRPVQLVVAGKSHPADEMGKRMIQDLVRFTDDPEVRHRIVFLPNYDIAMARVLFPGCDVWLNNPLRPLEACGTSGMKAAINGGLNLSVLDGWWDEMYDGQNGWAIPTADSKASTDERDDVEAAALYELIEGHVAPRFYGDGSEGTTPPFRSDAPEPTAGAVPHQWLAMVRHTLATLGPRVSSRRMLTDYVQQLYVPACVSGRRAAADDGAAARATAHWIQRVREAWPRVRVEHVEAQGVQQEPQIGDELGVNAYVDLGSLAPEDVTVQVGYGRVTESDHIHERSHAVLEPVTDLGAGRVLFCGPVTIDRSGPFGYTVRVLPRHPELADPAELALVCNAAD
ncbi:alpha-glucan family phosphorylase [Kocuria tytonis]|uniref:Glycosyltransferase family 1 protein n=1 Tax=Kocuria tytonis TaxID=2054280 RepID=A0A495A3T7_9MICC|nr:alpha-glucan family phosphorylase [Kocuria tytonis]RKQ33615.1 glycosyltransferase family 1 protein [Kocuria tytonis]